MAHSEFSIAGFLSGKTIFITGATGFLAKALTEKILRTAPQVRRVYLLIRPRISGGARLAEERLAKEIIASAVFDRLRERGDFAELTAKLHPVAGDLTEDKLGIPADDYKRIAAETDFVINSAATVVFDEPLDEALELNALGARRVAEFSAAAGALLAHVSTAYISGILEGRIPEEVLPVNYTVAANAPGATPLMKEHAARFTLEDEIARIRAFAQETERASKRAPALARFKRTALREARSGGGRGKNPERYADTLRRKWVRAQLVRRGLARGRELGWHDSYTFTKAMGEQIVGQVRAGVKAPTVMIRPSIIESSMREPEPGWLDGLKVTDPLIVHYGKGRLPDFPADPGAVVDLIPVDFVVNALLAAAASQAQNGNGISVYHVATGARNPVRVRQIFEWTAAHFRRYPMLDSRGGPIAVRPWKFPTMRRFRFRCRWRYQIPLRALSRAMDFAPALPWPRSLRLRVPAMTAMVENLLNLTELYGPYANLRCRFATDNLARLHERLSPAEREIFNCDVGCINWREYIQEIHIPGLKRHILKMDGASADGE